MSTPSDCDGHKVWRMHKKRFDIQGLRAVAVVSVIADHLFHRPSGGFVGVDVFFVISGFLITGLLLREFERTGRISLRDFYLRRVRRIAPAATVVLIVTVMASFVLLAASRTQSIALDALASFFFVSNWRFAASGTDYFQIGTAVSPLQHFWSLSVEEQFYLVWPVLVMVMLIATARRRTGATGMRRISPIATMMTIVTTVSFCWAYLSSVSDPTVAYFSTTTRAWELGVGALLALFAHKFPALKPATRTALAYSGLVGIAISVIVISPELPFPAPWALLPVLSTALVIVAGIGSDSRRVWLLSNPVSRYVGDISYSLYLWHFPVIIFLGVFMPTTSRAYFAIALMTMFGLAAASYAVIEKPLSQSPFLSSFPNKAARRASMIEWRRSTARGVKFGLIVALTVTVVTVASVSAYVVVKGGVADTAVTAVETPVFDPKASAATNQMSIDIADALNATEWPTLTPSASEVSVQGPVEDASGCGATKADDLESCSFGDPSNPAIVVWGDSTGITLLPTVRAVYGENYFIRGLTRAGCPSIELDTKFSSEAKRTACEGSRTAALDEIERLNPVVVFVTNNYEWANPLNLLSKAEGAAGISEWTGAARSTVDRISPHSDHVIFVSPPPQGKAIADCATTISTPSDCVSVIPSSWRSGSEAERALVGGKVAYVDTVSWFCAPSGRCPVFVDSTPVRRDGIHTSRNWAAHIAPLFQERTEKFISPTPAAKP
jgi:peptidoglycan/LPS O-acetylase OafA/YrhL